MLAPNLDDLFEAQSPSGSFWDTFGQAPATSGVLQVLEEFGDDDVSIDSLLGKDDLIQEYRDALNTKLRKWLCQKAVLTQCLEYILTEPPKDASHDRAHKYPFVISELLACDPEDLISAIANSEEALTQLFDFLFLAPTDETHAKVTNKVEEDDVVLCDALSESSATKSYSSCDNPVCAGYFSGRFFKSTFGFFKALFEGWEIDGTICGMTSNALWYA